MEISGILETHNLKLVVAAIQVSQPRWAASGQRFAPRVRTWPSNVEGKRNDFFIN